MGLSFRFKSKRIETYTLGADAWKLGSDDARAVSRGMFVRKERAAPLYGG